MECNPTRKQFLSKIALLQKPAGIKSPVLFEFKVNSY